jgi:hypothetical protein
MISNPFQWWRLRAWRGPAAPLQVQQASSGFDKTQHNKRASITNAGSFVVLIFQTECSYYNYLNFAEDKQVSERVKADRVEFELMLVVAKEARSVHGAA